MVEDVIFIRVPEPADFREVDEKKNEKKSKIIGLGLVIGPQL